MAASGFEGFEKRLELHFSGDDPLGLRRLASADLEEVLQEVQCSIVCSAGNRDLDAYVLSESSLFVYPFTFIIKTCGTTQLLKSIPCLLRHAAALGLELRRCRYSRGSFIFPKAQPSPHSSFKEEVLFLEKSMPAAMCYRKACVLPSKTSSHSWHVYSASDIFQPPPPPPSGDGGDAGAFIVEVCMTQLDRKLARRFHRRQGKDGGEDDGRTANEAGKWMTELTGIDGINPNSIICDYAFEPCGYSMNGIDSDRYSTIHVTPEDGYSYASFECITIPNTSGRADEIADVLRKVAWIFRPGTMSVSVTMPTIQNDEEDDIWSTVADALEPVGLNCRSRAAEEFPGVGAVTYQTFAAARRKKQVANAC